MSSFKNIGVKEYFKRYGFKNALFRGAFLFSNLHFVKDYENKKILYYRRICSYIKKKYLQYANTEPLGLRYTNLDENDPVWVFWKQGEEAAPDIVKVCINSVRKIYKKRVIVLSEKNIKDYVIFPKYIYKKMEEKKMSYAHFSDLLRFCLLEHFGGTWIDATVYLNQELSEYIMKSSFFSYRDSFGLIGNPALFSNWLIHCSANNDILKQTVNILFKYWEENDYVNEYLLSYIILTIVIESHPEKYKKIPYATSDYSHILFENLCEKYDKEKLEYIFSLSNVQKLSYKLTDETVNDRQNIYNYLIKGAVQN